MSKPPEPSKNPPEYILCTQDHRLELQQRIPGSEKPLHRIFVEFLRGPAGYRRARGGGFQQAIAKAVGITGKKKPRILDATAGLGQDAFVLSTLGAEVVLVERSPILFALLQDGLQRAAADPEVQPIVDRMQLIEGDAKTVICHFSDENAPDVIYLDPMFPTREKSALTKIEMRIIRDIVGADEDVESLFEIAVHSARERVVVKRPARAPTLTKLKPNFVVQGRRNRYDVYLIRG